MTKILYIGNNLAQNHKYEPTLVTLSRLLKLEGFMLTIASAKRNKILRMLDMAFTVVKYRKNTSFVLIDTYGAFNFYYALVISQVCRLLALPYIPILHGGSLPERFRNNSFYTQLIFGHSYKNVTPSMYLKDHLLKHGYKSKIIPNIININNYTFKNRASFSPKILYVRAFHQIYNPTMAVRVLHAVKLRYPEATLCMIGPVMDSSFNETKKLAMALNVENSIEFTGVLSKEKWHKIAEEFDIFINTTTIDNTPVSVMEAMAMGLPVVSTKVGGIPYLLNHGKDAFLVENNDYKAMAVAIIAIVENNIDVNEVVLNARRKVERFDWSIVRNQWIQLLGNKPPKKGIIDSIYDSCPVFIQNIIISMYGIYWKNRRLGGEFKSYVKEYKRRENFSTEEWKTYQTQELRKLLIHAYSTVPFYKELYSKHGFTLEDFKNFKLNDLSKLPFLEKDDLRKFGRSTLLSIQKDKGTFIKSSGSTGTPVSVYFSKKNHQQWNAAYEVRVRNWAEVHYKMNRGMIGGRRIVNSKRPVKPFYRFNSVENQTYFSAYYINEKNTPNYIEGMNKHHVDYMVGYAMSLYFLADTINKLGLKAPKLKAVLTSSEKLTKQMRTTMEKAFQCKIFDAYSGVEACGLVSENSDGELLFSPDTGIMEIVDELGNVVENGESGEVIATGLLNFDQPLIRYRIGDRVKLAKNQRTNSGMEMTVIEEVEGRVEDVVITKDGRKMVRFHGIFIDIPYLLIGQVVQYTVDEIQLNLVVEKQQFDPLNEVVMKSRIENQLGEVNVRFEYLDEIPKNSNGKFQAVISHIPNEAING